MGTLTQITRTFGFDAGHRVLGHESKCANLHGHRYTAEVTCQSPRLDKLDRVIDFSVIKTLVGGWIDEHWDHTMILNKADPLLKIPDTDWRAVFGPKEPYRIGCNPTAEKLAHILFNAATDLLSPHDITVMQIKMWETPNCFATYQLTFDL